MIRRAEGQPARLEHRPTARRSSAAVNTGPAPAVGRNTDCPDVRPRSASRWTQTWRIALLALSVSPILRWAIIHHAVKAGLPWSSACAHCSQRIGPSNWRPLLPTARCGHCRHRTGPAPWLVESTTVALAVLLVWARLPASIAPAYAMWALLGVALTFIDIAVHRLPDRLTWAAASGFLTLAVPAAALGHAQAWLRAAEAAALLTVGLAICAIARPGWIGPGDAKYGAAIGAAAGWVSWFAVYATMFIASLLGALVGLVLVIARRASRKSRFPLGPFLFVGVLLAVTLARYRVS